ncbi:serine protease 57-like [Latimeria chalumnae]|uniref:Peptidase S1 domain-containing protein n=1 Tax=Latimeria chalumnae TaxID=7897 RepID=M3XIH7_LATCH|nr:PREDICTED: serine protease 57-like [Latimeria chalumnae]|eukprot:XP_005992000.1 PREDICTED: serine protease 57-like [Latimeria chalumnae]
MNIFYVLVFLLSSCTEARLVHYGIVGGHEAKPHSKPYMASLQWGVQGNHFCGGFLIADQWVLTAAHCFDEVKPAAARIVLGAHSLNEREPKVKQAFRVEKYAKHHGYSKTMAVNDIFLIKLNKKAVLNSYVTFIALPKKNSNVTAGTLCSVAGWGETSNAANRTDKLQEANVTVVSRECCNHAWQGKIVENMICAGNKTGKGFCSGDSGGPLVCGDTAVGIVSFSAKACADPRFPDVYTRISRYIKWIKKIMNQVY